MSEQLDPEYFAKRLPEQEANWGYSIQELDPAQRTYRPVEELLVNRPDIPEIAARIVESGGIEIEEATTEHQPGVFKHYVDVNLYDYELKEVGLDALAVPGRSFKPENIENAELQERIHNRERMGLFNKAVQLVSSNLETDYLNIPNDMIGNVTDVSQVFEVDNGRGASFRILNFSETVLAGRNLQTIMNSFREMDDVTGGASTEAVAVVGIFPETFKRWRSVKEEAAEIGAKGTAAFASGAGIICLNEAMLKDKEPESTSQESLVVGPNDVGVTIFHELAHVIESDLIKKGATLPSEKFGWELERNQFGYIETKTKPEFKGHTHNPSKYGTTDHREDVAESAAAMFVGGEWAKRLDTERQKAIADMYQERHTGSVGPAFLHCKEIDLDTITADEKIGSKLKGPVKMTPYFNYKVITAPVI